MISEIKLLSINIKRYMLFTRKEKIGQLSTMRTVFQTLQVRKQHLLILISLFPLLLLLGMDMYSKDGQNHNLEVQSIIQVMYVANGLLLHYMQYGKQYLTAQLHMMRMVEAAHLAVYKWKLENRSSYLLRSRQEIIITFLDGLHQGIHLTQIINLEHTTLQLEI